MKNIKTNATYIALKNKSEGKGRMPSLRDIHNLLDSLGIDHWFYESTNIVESRSENRIYVNSRHEGKKGYEIKFSAISTKNNMNKFFRLDSSDSYYSWNTHRYAMELVDVIENINNYKFGLLPPVSYR